MNNELYVDNLHRIISKNIEKVQPGALDLAENFFQKIADDIFLMPPPYSNGHKFKYMLFNYLNLKTDTKSRFETEILSKWQSFQEVLAHAPSKIASHPEYIEKIPYQTESEKKEINPNGKTAGPELKSIVCKTDAPQTRTDKRPVPEQAHSRKATVKKSASPSAAKISGDKRKKLGGSKPLDIYMRELVKDMKDLEGKIEQMVKTFDRITELNLAGPKTVKK